MTHLFRTTLVLSTLVLASCSTVNTALNKTMGVLGMGKGEPAAEVTADGSAAPVPQRGLRVESNTVLMVLDINGTKRKVVIELDAAAAPKHVANFKKNVRSGVYDGMAFHRAIRNYLVQSGDPKSKTDDKNSWGLQDNGVKIAPEISLPHVKGSIAMARLGAPDAADKSSSGSQFYITLRSVKDLNGKYTVFGRVTQGMDALDAVGNAAVDSNDTPIKRVDIKTMRLVAPDSAELQEDPAAARRTKPDYEKGTFEKFIEKIW